jgi:hypothetical protein
MLEKKNVAYKYCHIGLVTSLKFFELYDLPAWMRQIKTNIDKVVRE